MTRGRNGARGGQTSGPSHDLTFERLAARYVSNLASTFAILRAALTERDFPALRMLAHRLAGTTGMYGFWSLNGVVTQLQDELQNREPPDETSVRLHIERLEEIADSMSREFERSHGPSISR